MKFLKKINKGLILTVIVIVILAIHIIHVEKIRKEQEPEIKAACENYINIINKYIVVPEKNKSLDNKMTEEEKTEYLNELEKELKNVMIDNNIAVENQKAYIEDLLENNKTTEKVTTKYTKEITKIKSMKFDGNQVVVSLESKVEKNIKYYDEPDENNNVKENEKIENFTTKEYGETITLQQIDGKWKVVYADLQYEKINYGISSGSDMITL